MKTFSLAFLRLEVMMQEEKIYQLRSSVEKLTNLNRKCDKLRKKDRRFLQTLIETGTRDNVPLSEGACSSYCSKAKVKDCDELCSPKLVRCSHWPDSSKCLKHINAAVKNNASLVRSKRSALDDQERAQTVVLTTGC